MENKKFIGENITIQKAANILSCYKEGDKLLKAYNNVIAKAEGARGGKVIGHTKSGKPIYESANHPSHKNFSIAEHDDAINAHQKVRDEYHNKHNSTDEDRKANDHAFEQQKEHIGAKNYMMKDMTPAQARAAVAESEAKNKPNEDESKSFKEGDEVKIGGKRNGVYHSKVEDGKKGYHHIKVAGTLEAHHEKDLVKKSEDNDIIKGGEGSRGGKIIGHTKSGKAIYAAKNDHDRSNFSAQDHKEAHDMHNEKANELNDLAKKNKDNVQYLNNASSHRKLADKHKNAYEAKKEIEKEKEDSKPKVKLSEYREHLKKQGDKELADYADKASVEALKKRYNSDNSITKSEIEETSDLQKAYETLGLGDLIQKGGE